MKMMFLLGAAAAVVGCATGGSASAASPAACAAAHAALLHIADSSTNISVEESATVATAVPVKLGTGWNGPAPPAALVAHFNADYRANAYGCSDVQLAAKSLSRTSIRAKSPVTRITVALPVVSEDGLWALTVVGVSESPALSGHQSALLLKHEKGQWIIKGSSVLTLS